MYCITDEQIDYILDDIRRNGVETEDLQLNLLDHICCIIEQNLEDNGDFEGFYQHTIRRFYKNELKEIEEEAIHLLTFKNYNVMKKLMIRSGLFSVFALLTGSVFKLMYWPATGVILVLGIVSFSLIFLPLLFLLKTKEASSSRDKLVLASAMVVAALYGLSTMFKIMYWPGANIMWFCTLIMAFFVALPLYFFNGIRKPEAKLNTIVTSIILVGILGLQFSMTPIRLAPRPDNVTIEQERVQQATEVSKQ